MAKIIAEFCQNHNGDRKLLKEMIWAAAESGADYAKIQSIDSSTLTKRERFEEGVTEGGITKSIKRPYQPEFDRLKKLDLSEDDHYFFIEECKKANIKPLTTVFNRGAIPFVSKFDWDEIKIASYDCASIPMLLELKNKFKNLIISTGATFDEEIKTTTDVLNQNEIKFSFLHCVTIYPTPLDDVNLSRIDFLRQFSPEAGFSDHTLVARDGIKASVAAIAHGADYIERHFTILDVDKSKDGPVSITPAHLKKLSKYSKMDPAELKAQIKDIVPEYDIMIGVPTRNLSDAELLNRDYYRGRFATISNGEYVYNWEDKPIING